MAVIIEGKTIQDVYKQVVDAVKNEEHLDNGTRELLNLTMVVEEPSTKNFWLPYRNISEKYANAELEWYWKGSNSCEEIGKFAKKWIDISDDGKTNNSAYGYVLQKKYGFNQIEQVIELLKKDPNSRRALLNISDPSIDRINTKDMQCTIAIQFVIRDNKLQTNVYMRSSDLWWGIPYDYLYFMSVAEYVAKELGLELGAYVHTNTSTHIYDRDFDKFVPVEKKVMNIDIEKIREKYYEK